MAHSVTTEPRNQNPPPPDDPEQSKRFIDTAREVEADESPEAFERAFERVVRPKDVEPKRKPKDAQQDAS